MTSGGRRDVPHSLYAWPFIEVRSDPLFTLNTPGSADGLLASGSAGTSCHVDADLVNGSSGMERRYPSLTRASRVDGYLFLSA
jgi:hypothetical protein